MKRLLAGLSLAFVALAAVSCRGGYSTPKPAATPPPAQGVPGQVSVAASYPQFQPRVIRVTKGQVLQLKVTATDLSHTFTISELGLNIAVGKGQTITKEIKLDRAGSFTFYCAVPGHRSAGMEGTLTVSE